MLGKKIKVVDTTLRNDEQRTGLFFTNEEKLRIAKMLDDIGVHQIEVGIGGLVEEEKETLKNICNLGLRASIMGWNRTVLSDIQNSIDCGVDAVAISTATSDILIEHHLKTSREWVLENMVESVEFARREGLYISVCAEDASRSDMDFLIQFATEAKKAGAKRLRFCDTIGNFDSFTTYEKVKLLRETTNIDIEIHTYNGFGMATANALAGLKAGATHVGVTVNGLGEGAGTAALEEVIMALKIIYGIDLGIKTEYFRDLSLYVAAASNRELPPWKAIVGTNMFAHESGIHADGALKNPATYEAFKPEDVGLERQIVIGKHSGTASITNKFAQYGLNLTDMEANEVLKKVRLAAVKLKRNLLDWELIEIYENLLENKQSR